jgi:hypothetical protein
MVLALPAKTPCNKNATVGGRLGDTRLEDARLQGPLPVNMYEIYGGTLIFEISFVVLEIFDFGIVRYGPNLPP